MGFTTPCFIRKNTAELRKKLEELGYKDYGKLRFYGDPITIYCDGNHFFTSPFVLEGEQYRSKYNNFIDCGDNEELFLAIAALRDDNDYMQWFVHDEPQQWVNIDRWVNIGDMFIVMTEHNQSDWKCHKATLKEIINKYNI